jgi:tetratricopeptide (TPR) repeat protein
MTGTLARQQLVEQARNFYRSGRTYYDASRLNETIEQFDCARRLAAAAADTDLESVARFWEGAALHGAGRLSEALAIWAPCMTAARGVELTAERYLMMTRSVLVAVDLPLPYALLQRAFADLERHLRTTASGPRRRSRLLLARSRLAMSRGDAAASLSCAVEALARSRGEALTYSTSTFLRAVTHAGLRAGQASVVAEFIREWDRTNDGYPESKRLALTAARADLARYSGDPKESLRLAGRVAQDALRSDDVVYAYDATRAYVRASLAAGVPDQARQVIGLMLRLRRSAVGEQRFDVILLLGDYHASRAMLCLRGHAEDLEFEPRRNVAVPNATSVSACSLEREIDSHGAGGACVLSAGRAYSLAEREGARLDELLATRYHQDTIARRRACLMEGLR